ncbi:hypothetical protein NSA52_17585 [Clostridium sporogenes]|uniref:hypothetical protein n=1 Tax=Clostridium sporogenes TaxID=1509 RepID=UPI002149F5BE|nr:hypothetical protein [Clostridium sporogenes]MCR1975925.1 hypothetical protein [Clostridium sporogenes]
MNKIYQIYYIGISDFLDRIRSKNILIITLLMMYIPYLLFPETHNSFYHSLNYFYGKFFYRGVYNSVWIGWVSTLAFVTFITLIGFYFVRNSITRERELLIGEVTASIGVKSWIFIFGKCFGNFIFLLLQMVVVILITFIMQFVRSESYYFEPIKFLTPFLILAMPACFITAVIAIIFDIVPFLSNLFGNIVYFILWTFIGLISIMEKTFYLRDIGGIDTTVKIVLEQLKNNFKKSENINLFNFGNYEMPDNKIRTFTMNIVNISENAVLGRIFWSFTGLMLLFLVAMIFKRTFVLSEKMSNNIKKDTKEAGYDYNKEDNFSKILKNETYSNNLSILKSEVKIIFTLPNLWWYIAVILCSIGLFFVEDNILYKFLIPVIWILPILIWSEIGKVSSCMVKYGNKQLLNSIVVGFIFTIFVNIAVIIKFVMLNNFLGIFYILMAIFFVNSLSVFIENVNISSTLFEMIYIILWYMGILNDLIALDFLGLTEKASSDHIPIIFLAIGIVLLIASIIIKNNRIEKLSN